jgi:IS30 family transposase
VEILRRKGYSLRDIGETLGIWFTAIAYELHANTRKRRSYDAAYAKLRAYTKRRYARPVGTKIGGEPRLRKRIDELLLDLQSPENVAGRIAYHERYLPSVSPFAIRRYIESPYGRRIEAARNKLLRKRRKRAIRTVYAGKRMISKRPRKIKEKKEFGHCEGDFIVSGKSGTGMVLDLSDIKARYTLLERILPVSARTVTNALLRMKKRFPEMQSITFDNDILLLHHKELEQKLGIRIYFCHPHSPWEKPLIENRNKILRQFIPKSSDISRCSRSYITKLEAYLNRRIMKCLRYQTPDEAIAQYRKRKKRR